MTILLYYRYAAHSVGRYWEEALQSAGHTVVFCGPGEGSERAGYAPGIDLAAFVRQRNLSPDLFIYVDSHSFPTHIHQLPCPTVAYFVDVHLGERWKPQAALLFDHVYIAQKDYLQEFIEAGNRRVEWLPLACQPPVHTVEGAEHSTYDVTCIGQRGPAHAERVRLQALIEARYHVKFDACILREEMSRIYGASRVVFNKSINGDVNMRVFEGLASGAMVLTDEIGNGLTELFHVGEDLVTYEDATDLLQKLDYYMQHEEERQRVAACGQAKALAGHTYADRVAVVLSAVQSLAVAGSRTRVATDPYRIYATAHYALHDTPSALTDIRVAWQYSRPQGKDLLLLVKCIARAFRAWMRAAMVATSHSRLS